jgi:hypothetical protein
VVRASTSSRLAPARIDRGDVGGIGDGDLHHAIDEQPEALFGGNAAGRSVGRFQQAQFFQILHHVADGGRGQLQAAEAGQGARADGRAGGEIAVHDFAEDAARAL